MANWTKLNLFYLGESKKHHRIFRAKKWNDDLKKVFKKSIYNEKFERIGQIKDLFGPVKMPFISVKATERFSPDDVLYIKL